jgi:preprotein translocase subunit SecA
MREVEQVAIVRAVDAKWKDHLYAMDLLKEGIGLRAFGQKDPLIEYKNEGFNLFSEMIAGVKMAAVEFLFRVQVGEPERIHEPAPAPARAMVASHDASAKLFSADPQPAQQAAGSAETSPQGSPKIPVRVGPKVGRNDPCPCNSGKKYKKCCGQ